MNYDESEVLRAEYKNGTVEEKQNKIAPEKLLKPNKKHKIKRKKKAMLEEYRCGYGSGWKKKITCMQCSEYQLGGWKSWVPGSTPRGLGGVAACSLWDKEASQLGV